MPGKMVSQRPLKKKGHFKCLGFCSDCRCPSTRRTGWKTFSATRPYPRCKATRSCRPRSTGSRVICATGRRRPRHLHLHPLHDAVHAHATLSRRPRDRARPDRRCRPGWPAAAQRRPHSFDNEDPKMSDELTRQAGQITIGELLYARVRQHPDRVAVVDGGRQFSFADFNGRVNRLAAVLRVLDIGRADRVAILSENRVEYLELMFAAGKLGAIVCALNWRLADPELI